jgi:hypothetical protein
MKTSWPLKGATKSQPPKKNKLAQSIKSKSSPTIIAPEPDEFIAIKKEHVLKNDSALSKIPIHLVANLAGSLSWIDQQSSIEDRVRIAYHLLDAVASANSSMIAGKSMHEGLKEHTLYHYFQHIKASNDSDNDRDPLIKLNKNGTAYELVDFQAALDSIFGRETQKKDRVERLTLFVQNTPGDNPISRIDAEGRIKKWKSEGIPPDEYSWAKLNYHHWYPNYKSHLRSLAGKSPKKKNSPDPQSQKQYSGVENTFAEPAHKAKGKQGRVIRKNDKRIGSKAGSFLKALKKTP